MSVAHTFSLNEPKQRKDDEKNYDRYKSFLSLLLETEEEENRYEISLDATLSDKTNKKEVIDKLKKYFITIKSQLNQIYKLIETEKEETIKSIKNAIVISDGNSNLSYTMKTSLTGIIAIITILTYSITRIIIISFKNKDKTINMLLCIKYTNRPPNNTETTSHETDPPTAAIEMIQDIARQIKNK